MDYSNQIQIEKNKIMKAIKMAVVAMVCMAAASVQAQVSINVNIGSAPVYHAPRYEAPVYEEPVCEVPVRAQFDYYFLPEINAYYDVHHTEYIYLERGNWVRSRRLPVAYCNFDVRRARTIVINDYHGSRPYDNYNRHRVQYCKPLPKGRSYQYRENNRYNNTVVSYERPNRYQRNDCDSRSHRY